VEHVWLPRAGTGRHVGRFGLVVRAALA